MDASTTATPTGPSEGNGRVTPVMEQYIEIKAANPDCLLFYRMGDFYELFFDDAETASRALGIVLTKRGKHQGHDIPMCGVPVHRADEYLHRLIALGHRVAVCEQMEDPAEARKRGAKSVVRRDVTRLVTPGTLTEDSLLDARRNNYLVALARARTSSTETASLFALAFLDISTGEFRVMECDRLALAAEIARLEPGEIVVSDALYADPEVAPYLRTLPVTPLARDVFDGATAERRLAAYFAVATTQAFGTFSRLELTAAAACITYVERTQLGSRPPLSPPTREAAGATLMIDAATRANLELTRTLTGERPGSLAASIDRTVTSAGARLLNQRLAAPLTDPMLIAQRLDSIETFVDDSAARAELRERLAAAPDIARSLARLVVGRGGPRDLAAIRDGLAAAEALARRLAELTEQPAEIAAAAVAASARGSRLDAADRRRDAHQSRTDPHVDGRAPRLAAFGDRPYGDGGGLAPAHPAARGAAHRHGRDHAPARCRRGFRHGQREADRGARAPCRGARPRARDRAPRGRPWRPARSGGDPRRPWLGRRYGARSRCHGRGAGRDRRGAWRVA